MRFYSDMLEKFFDSEEECLAAEKETLDKSRKAIQRANDELELKELRKKISDLRTNLENSLEEYYRLQNKYFDNYGTLCNMTEEGGHPDPVGEKGDYCECSDDCDYKPVGKFNIYMKHLEPLRETYPNLWNLFYGGH